MRIFPGQIVRVLLDALRAGALFLGAFTLLNVLGEWWRPGFSANIWWIRLPIPNRPLETVILIWTGICLVSFGVGRVRSRRAMLSRVATFAGLAAVCCWNSWTYYQLLWTGEIQSSRWLPFSLLVSFFLGGLAFVSWSTHHAGDAQPHAESQFRFRGMLWRVGLSVVIAGIFPLALMYSYGATDYRRSADLIVVFGAKVHPNGKLSSILEERLQTGCRLFHQGWAPRLLLSGGPGTGDIHETEGMRRHAIALGVPESAIILDSEGWDTESTAVNATRLARRQRWNRVLAVSQEFHLPRIKLAFLRCGFDAFTVPAIRRYNYAYMPYFMAREVAAWWFYYLRPLWKSSQRADV